MFNRDGQSQIDEELIELEPQPFPVFIDDVEIEKSPAHIVSLSPALTEILFEFGEGGRLIGKSDYCDYPVAVKKTDTIKTGSGFNVTQVIQLSPDLLNLLSHF